MTEKIQKARLGLAPALLVYKDKLDKAAHKGTVLFYHGLSAAKETNLKELRSLADAGFLAVGLDNMGHGERKYSDFEKRFSSANPNLEAAFVDAVRETARETPLIIDDLHNRYGIPEDRVGIAGISMGGFIAYAALLEDARLQAATPVLGSPAWRCNGSESPGSKADRFFPKAILSQNAGEDSNVPPRGAREFHKALEPYYAEAPDRQRYIEFEGVGHFMPEEEWNRLWKNVLSWFGRFLDRK